MNNTVDDIFIGQAMLCLFSSVPPGAEKAGHSHDHGYANAADDVDSIQI